MTDFVHVAPKDEVDNIPEWAQQFDVGDTIQWENGDLSGESEVIGFSTLYVKNYPTIEAPESINDNRVRPMETTAVTRKSWVGDE